MDAFKKRKAGWRAERHATGAQPLQVSGKDIERFVAKRPYTIVAVPKWNSPDEIYMDLARLES